MIRDAMKRLKKILIVDDSEIDRGVLRGILEREFEVYEADNGYSALGMIVTRKRQLDAIFLDISMPILDGLSVLRIMWEIGVQNIPVFMITSEATKDNIEKAMQYHVEDFIKKPFSRDTILQRLRDRLGVELQYSYSEKDISKTKKYIADLTSIYNQYIVMAGKDKRCDEFRSHLMSILLKHLPSEKKVDSFQLEMLTQSAYLCNIGNMFLFDTIGKRTTENSAMFRQHTILGSKLVQLNYSESCRLFVRICSDICLHHHERFDGRGFPNGLSGNSISEYAQMCGLLEEFDKLFFPCSKHNEKQFDYAVEIIARDIGFVSEEVFSLLLDSKSEIIRYYSRYAEK